MNNRWNPNLLVDDEEYEYDEENPFDFDDKPHLRNGDDYHRQRTRLGVAAFAISIFLFVFIGVFLFGLATLVDRLK